MAKYFIIFVMIALFLAGFLTYRLSKDFSDFIPIEDQEKDVSLEVYEFQNWHEFAFPKEKSRDSLPL